MNFIDFLKSKEERFCEFKLKQAEYDNEDKSVTLTLLFPEKYRIVSDDDKAFIQSVAEEYLEHKYKILIKYKKSYVDCEVVWNYVDEFFNKQMRFGETLMNKEYLSLKPIDKESLDILQNADYDCYEVDLKMPKSLGETFENRDLIDKLTQYLMDNICANFKVCIDASLAEEDLQAVLKRNDRRQTELSILRDVSIPDEEKYFEFEILEDFVGHVTENIAIRIDQLKTASENDIIAGTLKSVNVKTYPDKRDETKEKTMYILTLQDFWGEKRCTYFPSADTKEKMQELKEGDQLAFLGNNEEYKGAFSFKISAIARIKLGERPEENMHWREPFDEYLVVNPEPYIEMTQMNLLNKEETQVGEYMLEHDIVVFDFETTGLSVDDCYIIELGAVKIHKGKLTETFESFVKPPVSIPQEVVDLTHITDEMVADAPVYELVLADFYKFTRGCVLSAYNIDFDAKFLDKYGRSILYNFDNEQIDTLVLARQKLKGMPNYKLKSVVNRLGVELVSAHRALDDAVACAKVFQKLI